ncbi:MAG: HAMP domain-containing histidine kinase [Oscillospiraceae bacterium]|jgi:signal transduction histidine kinase|nr:HAMP domain-containing histidine kinase [Oscillospiraceae bacterium]
MFKKLRNKMVLFSMTAVSLVLIIAFGLIYFVSYQNQQAENAQRLAMVSSMLFTPNRPPPTGDFFPIEPDVEAEANALLSPDYAVSFTLLTYDGELAAVDSRLDLSDSVYAEAFARIAGRSEGRLTLAEKQWIYRAEPLPANLITNDPGHDLSRIVFLDVTSSANMLRTLLITLLGACAAVLLVFLFLSFRFAADAVRPIEASYNKQRQFVADASHELRTPLAVIGANMDVIALNGAESVDSQREWFGYIRAQLKRMGNLAEELLTLAKSENAEGLGGEAAAFDLSGAANMACASVEAVLYENGIAFESEIAPEITITASESRIAQVLHILLDNASKYTAPGGKVKATLHAEGNQAILRVMNTADIAPESLPKLFDRFYRVDSARSSETGGAGLGLAIAKSIVEGSGGSIAAESANGETTFTVKFKR